MAFQSTPSAWRETVVGVFRIHKIFISIHSLRMEGDLSDDADPLSFRISIHSLRMEGDAGVLCTGIRIDISIHSLRMEGDATSPAASCTL